ncbi:TrbI/VirB10 family protein [Niveispirillum sp. KHB5.9]|uniref:TrbI/VirB10 family protein n=1 Tax=Niveispirillum sp. KHB5.9 TaxID=3400269 RepID=UPI003A852226
MAQPERLDGLAGGLGLVRAVRESTQQNADRAGQRLTERNLDIQPTLTVRPGWPLRVIIRRNVILSPYQGG